MIDSCEETIYPPSCFTKLQALENLWGSMWKVPKAELCPIALEENIFQRTSCITKLQVFEKPVEKEVESDIFSST